MKTNIPDVIFLYSFLQNFFFTYPFLLHFLPSFLADLFYLLTVGVRALGSVVVKALRY